MDKHRYLKKRVARQVAQCNAGVLGSAAFFAANSRACNPPPRAVADRISLFAARLHNVIVA
ncbi:hypothetical protein PI125_g2059 [Phytophthora idaei]|nr:hypothetical protein PI125_g2059 [Phytophthora idaei]